MSLPAFHACNRFGLGAGPGEIAAVARDPRGWLKAQLQKPVSIPSNVATAPALTAMVELMREKKVDKDGAKENQKILRNAYVQGVAERVGAQATSDMPFMERLVMFWSNHFTVSIQKKILAGLVIPFENEAIRPHVTGRFSDMLRAVTQHPAMLLYLDNAQSIGPNSRAGVRRGKGLNENLGREILELHTLGVDGGYGQADVIALAKIITGWSLDRAGIITAPAFKFQDNMHESGDKTLLGRRYRENGIREGVDALNDLAAHPATAQHIATKLARHFISDTPDNADVAQIARVFQDTGGDLKAVSALLVDMDSCWKEPLAKYKNPYEFFVSSCRATAARLEPQQILRGLEGLNYRVFAAASPAGYADTAAAWASPDALMKRIEWAQAMSRQVQPVQNPLDLAQAIIGPVMQGQTQFIIKGAETGKDGLAFLLSSPEFQRR